MGENNPSRRELLQQAAKAGALAGAGAIAGGDALKFIFDILQREPETPKSPEINLFLEIPDIKYHHLVGVFRCLQDSTLPISIREQRAQEIVSYLSKLPISEKSAFLSNIYFTLDKKIDETNAVLHNMMDTPGKKVHEEKGRTVNDIKGLIFAAVSFMHAIENIPDFPTKNEFLAKINLLIEYMKEFERRLALHAHI